MPQTTHLMEDRVVTFQLPAVMSERWAGMFFPIELFDSLLSVHFLPPCRAHV